MKPDSKQYTVRGVPARIDKFLRRQAHEQRKSLNQVLLEALERHAGFSGVSAPVHDDLDEIIGTWVEDPDFDAAIAAQDEIDEGIWE